KTYFTVTHFDFIKFRELWYLREFNPRVDLSHYDPDNKGKKNVLVTDEIMVTMCTNYMDMLQWNLMYYAGAYTPNGMMYKYTYPPFFFDLNIALSHITLPTVKWCMLNFKEIQPNPI